MAENKKAFKIVNGSSLKIFEEEINKLYNQDNGYKPYGSLVYIPLTSEGVQGFFQLMFNKSITSSEAGVADIC